MCHEAGEKTVITNFDKRIVDSVLREACVVVINGSNLGRKYSLATTTVIGRSSICEIQVDEESVSRNHAKIVNHVGRLILRDLGSTNGTYLNDKVIGEDVLLEDGDQIKIGHTILKFLSSSNIEQAYYEAIYRMMTIDGLTETFNKRYFKEVMEQEVSRGLRYARDLALIMMDLDHFKNVNDTYGHLAGDHVLKQCAKHMQSVIRRHDTLARYGGEEFILLLPEVDKSGAMVIGEKIRSMIESASFVFHNTEIKVTVSLGVADIKEHSSLLDFSSDSFDIDALIELADTRLYVAKRRGRNQVVGH